MRTFEEWSIIAEDMDRLYSRETLFNLAREDMIPADQAIKVPPVEEWSTGSGKDFKGLAVYGFPTWAEAETDQKELGPVRTSDGVKMVFVGYIPRPVPAWVPKVGDPVFCKVQPSDELIVGIIGDILGARLDIKYDGIVLGALLDDVKPFSTEKIGLPWEKI